MSQGKEDRSLGDLFRDLSGEMITLLRQELEFAKTEMSQKLSQTGRDMAFLAIGGAVAFAGFLCALAAVIALLAKIMPLWGAALLVGVIVGSIGFILVKRGIERLKHEEHTPKETVELLKEDTKWLKSQMT